MIERIKRINFKRALLSYLIGFAIGFIFGAFLLWQNAMLLGAPGLMLAEWIGLAIFSALAAPLGAYPIYTEVLMRSENAA